MNNDWRNSNMSYGYRAGQQGNYDAAFADQQRASYGAQQGDAYGRYSARHAASTQDYGYASRASYDNMSGSAAQGYGSYAQKQESAHGYAASDYSKPSYGGYGTYDTRTSYGASSLGYGYAKADYRRQAGAPVNANRPQNAPQDPYGYGGYRQGGYAQDTRQQNGYQPTYSQGAYPQGSYSQPTYNRPTYSQPAYQQPAYRPAYFQGSYGQPTYGGSAYTGYAPAAQNAAPEAKDEPAAAQTGYGYGAYYQAPQSAADVQNPAQDDVEIPEMEEPVAQATVRTSRPVTPIEKKNQMTAQPKRPASRPDTGDLSDDMQSRLERMRRAGEAALRAQGYQEDDATNFMNTGMINLDAAIGSMDETGGVDPVISVQQTARMAVIRQAQMDAPLQQPTTPALRAQNSRPGYSAKKEDGTHEEQRKKSLWRNIIEWVVLIALAVGAAFLLRAYVVSFYLVQGSSMEPTFYTGQRLLVNKISYSIGDIRRFDTVVCHYPGSENYYVKRVIGLPGDTVYIDQGQVYVNGEALEETYVDHADTTGMMEVVVADGTYLVFGDNRIDSLDSRSIGAIEEDAIVGRVIAITWPLSDFSAVKRLQDNVPSANEYASNAENDIAEAEDADTQTPKEDETDVEDVPDKSAQEAEEIPTDDNTAQ